MRSKFLKLLVPVLVLAMLLQVPFALVSTASTLSQATSINFTLAKSEAADAPGNIEVNMFAITTATAKITTLGATIVFDTDVYDLVDKTGTVVTDSYKVDSVQLGSNFPLIANEFDDEDGLESMGDCSIASYNATSKQMYLFIAGLNVNGVNIAENSKIATFYLQLKDGCKPSESNIRVMRTDEYKNAEACPSQAIASGEISSKSVVFTPAVSDLVENVTLTIDYSVGGTIDGVNAFVPVNALSEVTVKLVKGEEVLQTKVTNEANGFGFEEVEEGTYTILVEVPGSLGHKVENVVVNEGETTTVSGITLIYGNYNNNDTIDLEDLSSIIVAASGTGYDSLADVNGNEAVEMSDITTTITNYGALAVQQVTNLGE